MIYISVGHYEEKPGACFNGFCEFNEAKEWVKLIIERMHKDNALRVPTGTLKQKVDFINQRSPIAAVEVHFNSMLSGTNASGSETLYHPHSKGGKQLAIEVQLAMHKAGLRDRGVKEGYYRADKTKGVDFFLDKTNCPAIIIEPEFIFNKDTILMYREKACTNIAETLLGYLKCQKTT